MMNNPFRNTRFYAVVVMLFIVGVFAGVGCIGNMIEIDMSRDEIGVQNNHAIRVEPVRGGRGLFDVCDGFPVASPTTQAVE